MGSAKYQYGAALCANLVTMIHGAVFGWPSAAVILLMSDESPLPTGKISLDEASWLTALVSAGMLMGNLLSGWITERYGRKWPLVALAVPSIAGWTLIMTAQNINHLYIARFLNGLTGGGAYVIMPAFVSEIAEDKIRGALGSMLVLTCNVGILLIFILGNYATYEFAPKVVIGIQLLFLCTFPFFPESPQFLLKQNKSEEAEKSLCFYRGVCKNDNNQLIRAELDKMKLARDNGNQSKQCDKSSGLSLDDFKSIEAKKALIISFVLVVLNHMCGCFAMLNYTAKFFAEAGSNLPPNTSAIFVGACILIGSYVTLLMVDRLGRKLLVCLSATGICLGQVCLGTYALLKDYGFDVDDYRWINLVSFSFVIFIAAWGVLSLPLVIVSEILPVKIRNIGLSFATVVQSITSFAMLKMFPYISDAFGVVGSMYLFAGFTLSGGLFVFFCMPETKGRTFEGIAELLRK